jgi:hypothetical protein
MACTSFTVAQPLWEMTGGLLAMDIRTGEGQKGGIERAVLPLPSHYGK